jgi:hypothetical protein
VSERGCMGGQFTWRPHSPGVASGTGGRVLLGQSQTLKEGLIIQVMDRAVAARLVRRVVVAGSLTIVLAQAAMFAIGWIVWRDWIPLGLDWLGYRGGFDRLLATGTPYAAFELAGPFHPEHLDFIHPPNFLPLVAPFAILPQPLDYIAWVVIPVAIYVWLLRRLSWWAWPIVAFLSTTNSLQYPILNGNSSLWFCAAFGLGLRWGWPVGLIAMKPSLAPLAIVGLRRPIPTFFLAVIPLVLTIPLFPPYLIVLRNMDVPWWYSWGNYSLIALAALPWLTERLPHWLARIRALPSRPVREPV